MNWMHDWKNYISRSWMWPPAYQFNQETLDNKINQKATSFDQISQIIKYHDTYHILVKWLKWKDSEDVLLRGSSSKMIAKVSVLRQSGLKQGHHSEWIYNCITRSIRQQNSIWHGWHISQVHTPNNYFIRCRDYSHVRLAPSQEIKGCQLQTEK